MQARRETFIAVATPGRPNALARSMENSALPAMDWTRPCERGSERLSRKQTSKQNNHSKKAKVESESESEAATTRRKLCKRKETKRNTLPFPSLLPISIQPQSSKHPSRLYGKHGKQGNHSLDKKGATRDGARHCRRSVRRDTTSII
jgi:hypothetical protein